MSRIRKEPLRALTDEEQSVLRQIARSPSEPAGHVARAKILLAVHEGKSYGAAAQAAGRKSNDAVSHLVRRFNQEGLAALAPRHGGGAQVVYGPEARERILREVRRSPAPAQDGTATWSLSTLQRTLRQAADGSPTVSTYTIWSVLHGANLSWQQSRSWCETGQVKRRRKQGVVTVTDPDTEAKKRCLLQPISMAPPSVLTCGAMTRRDPIRRCPSQGRVGSHAVSQCASPRNMYAKVRPSC